ncbi:MAG: TonB-dependent receptor [Xanthomonadales bacterium]|nr:TonB-dependent receptor [Xanthomonadales bacterium]
MVRRRTLGAVAVALAVATIAAGFTEALARESSSPQPSGPSAVIVLDAEALRASGLVSLGDVLARLPMAGPASARDARRSDGTASVDLRGLGAGRTLVLVEGRRWPGGLGRASTDAFDGFAFNRDTDLDSIPLAAVERIEIHTGAAAAHHGSGAIAGVVDIRLRRDFDGLQASTHWGEFGQGDGRRQRHEFLLGVAGERGHVTMGAGHVREDAVMAGDRAISAVPVFGLPATDTTYAGASHFGPWPRLFIPGIGQQVLIPGRPGTAPEDFHPFNAAREGWNFAPSAQLRAPLERTSLFADARYRLGGDVEFHGQAHFNERRSEQVTAALPLAGGVFSQTPMLRRIAIPTDNLYNPFGVEVTGFIRRPVELGGRRSRQDVDTWVVDAGLRGVLDMAGHRLAWDLGVRHGRTERRGLDFGHFSASALERALGPSFIDADGTPRCGFPGAVVAGCVPLNLFGPEGSITPAMGQGLAQVGQSVAETRLTSHWAEVAGEAFQVVPGMPAQFRLGWTQRRETLSETPDAFANQALGTAPYRASSAGSQRVEETFVSLHAPFWAGSGGLHLLSATVDLRHAAYDALGSELSGSARLDWQPVADLHLYAAWGRGHRAPVLAERFRSTEFDSRAIVLDPCMEPHIGGLTPAAQARCYADGVLPGVTQTGIIPTYLAGNDRLAPERSHYRSVGLAWSPAHLESFVLGLSRFRSEVREGIGELAQQFVVNGCYLSDDAAVRARLCPLLARRRPGGLIESVQGGPVNHLRQDLEGWDLDASYRLDTALGRIDLHLDASYLSRWDLVEFDLQQFDTQPGATPGRLGQYRGGSAGFDFSHDPVSLPRWRATARLDWRLGDFGIGWGMRYQHHVDEGCPFFLIEQTLGIDNPCSNPEARTPAFPAGYNRQASTTYHDLRLSWNTPWRGEAALGVDNLFANSPPVAYGAPFHSHDTRRHEAPGRFWYLQYRQRW